MDGGRNIVVEGPLEFVDENENRLDRETL